MLIGALIGLLLAVLLMRFRMIETLEVGGEFDRVCEALSEAIPEEDGWGMPVPPWDMHAAVSAKAPFEKIRKLKVFFSCKALYARRIVDACPWMSGVMPCSWAVYETEDGRVFLAKMNIPLMAWVFAGGVVGRIMGAVGREEESILERLRSRMSS